MPTQFTHNATCRAINTMIDIQDCTIPLSLDMFLRDGNLGFRHTHPIWQARRRLVILQEKPWFAETDTDTQDAVTRGLQACDDIIAGLNRHERLLEGLCATDQGAGYGN
jgi:hypothetical protein